MAWLHRGQARSDVFTVGLVHASAGLAFHRRHQFFLDLSTSLSLLNTSVVEVVVPAVEAIQRVFFIIKVNVAVVTRPRMSRYLLLIALCI